MSNCGPKATSLLTGIYLRHHRSYINLLVVVCGSIAVLQDNKTARN